MGMVEAKKMRDARLFELRNSPQDKELAEMIHRRFDKIADMEAKEQEKWVPVVMKTLLWGLAHLHSVEGAFTGENEEWALCCADYLMEINDELKKSIQQ